MKSTTHVVKDRRRFARVRLSGVVPHTAVIITDPKSPGIPCTLVNISAGGACIEVASPEILTKRFGLLHGKTRKRCVVVWRNHHLVGVKF